MTGPKLLNWPQSFLKRGGVVSVECLWLMLLWVMGMGFDNTCVVQGNEMFLGLFQDFIRWVDTTTRLN